MSGILTMEEAERRSAELQRATRPLASSNGRERRASDVLILPRQPAEQAAPTRLPSARLRTVEELLSMKPPAFLIDGYLPERASVILYGPTGSAKSFEALEMACCIASGLAWHGLAAVRQGYVVFIAAEGQGGMGKRLRAWLAAHPGADLSRLLFILDPVNLMQRADVDTLVATLSGLPEAPVLVIHDTLARSMSGGDENSTRDATVVMSHVGVLMERFPATVMLVHHSGHAAERERGSSVFRQAADVSISLRHDDGVTTIRPEKTKDGEFFEPVRVRLQAVPGTDSCVLVPDVGRGTSTTPTPRQLAIMELLRSHFLEDGATHTDWLEVSGLPKNTFLRDRKHLIDNGYVTKTGHRFLLTERGQQVPGPNQVPSGSHGTEAKGPKGPTTLKSGTSGTLPAFEVPDDELPWPAASRGDDIPEAFR